MVDHLEPNGERSELRMVRYRPPAPGPLEPGSSGVMDVTRLLQNPFTGFFAALTTGLAGLTLVGPEFDPRPSRPTVRSLLLRLGPSCF